MGLFSCFRLARATLVLARAGAFAPLQRQNLPFVPRMLLAGLQGIAHRKTTSATLERALVKLGPTYVKFGQALATRPDIVGAGLAHSLSALQDRMQPFAEKHVPALLQKSLGPRAADFTDLSPPIAAASIAQVHKATLSGPNGKTEVAVKILRPRIAERFARDFRDFYAGARLLEALAPDARRLRPVESLKSLEHAVKIELDLRLEAAAISRFRELLRPEDRISAPGIHWEHTGQGVLTTDFVDAIKISDQKALAKAGLNRSTLAASLLQGFLRHAIHNGYFHADMHPGNLFADPATGNIIAVDFGIMGQISLAERRFLAEVLFGFIKRDYDRLARRHFDMGYVPRTESVEEFSLALRAIGEPLQGKPADEISMASVLGQLLAVTELFSMQTRPELLLLQKTMVMVEGVARSLDPEVNIWTVSEPVVADWMQKEMGPAGRLAALKSDFDTFLSVARALPPILERANAWLERETQRQTRRTRSVWIFSTLGLLVLAGAFLAGMWIAG